MFLWFHSNFCSLWKIRYCVLLSVFLLNIQMTTLMCLHHHSSFFSQNVRHYNIFYLIHYWKTAIPAHALWIIKSSFPFLTFFFSFLILNCGMFTWKRKYPVPAYSAVFHFVILWEQTKPKMQDSLLTECFTQ